MNSKTLRIIIAVGCLLASSAWPQEHFELPTETQTPTTGVTALHHRGDRTAVAKIEVRWNLAERWAVVEFGGRYHLMPDLGLWIGIDIARGPEETNPYVQIGHAW